MLQYLPVRDETLCQIQNLTQEDAILKTLASVINKGWPESKLHLPPEVQDYFEFLSQKSKYPSNHVTSSPTYPQSNGMVENAAKTVQQIMLKALEAGNDSYLGFLDFRNTPTEGLGTSPAQRLFGRRT